MPCKILTTNIWGSQFGFHNVLNLQSPTSLTTLVILVKFWKNSGLRGNISNLLKVDCIEFFPQAHCWPPKKSFVGKAPRSKYVSYHIIDRPRHPGRSVHYEPLVTVWSALVTLQRIKNAPSKALYLLLLLLLSEFQSVSIRRLSLLQAASKQLRADD